MATAGTICLDPRPVVGEVMQALHYDRNKMTPYIDQINDTLLKECEPKMAKFSRPRSPMSPSVQHARFRLAAIIENGKATQEASDSEPYYGLDVKKDPSRFNESTIDLCGQSVTL